MDRRLLTAELLASPAQHAVRVVALDRLADVRERYGDFTAGAADGLHDLRVALRRLRSWLRAFRPELDDTLRRKTRRRLSRVWDATNRARDAETALEWLAAQQPLPSRARPGCRHFTDLLQRECSDAARDASRILAARLPALIGALTDQLQTYWQRESVANREERTVMASVARDVVTAHADELSERLARLGAQADDETAHRARIAAKRLRYLVEPFADPRAAALAAHLTVLQNTLGEAHDAQLIVGRLLRELDQSAARDARRRALAQLELPAAHEEDTPSFAAIRPGLIELARRAVERQRSATARFRRNTPKRKVKALRASAIALVGEAESDSGER